MSFYWSEFLFQMIQIKIIVRRSKKKDQWQTAGYFTEGNSLNASTIFDVLMKKVSVQTESETEFCALKRKFRVLFLLSHGM